jgi:hypothetical protein
MSPLPLGNSDVLGRARAPQDMRGAPSRSPIYGFAGSRGCSECVRFAVAICPVQHAQMAYHDRYTLMARENCRLTVDLDQGMQPREGVGQRRAAAGCRHRGALPLPGKRWGDRLAQHCRTS